MKHDIKTNLKLASVCATAMMTLSGCEDPNHVNVIEAVSFDKLLVKDITDGEERIIELGKYYKNYMDDGFKYYHVGDTITIIDYMPKPGYRYEQCIPVWNSLDAKKYSIYFSNDSLKQRRYREYKQQQQAKFDSLKCVIARENRGKQR